MSVACFPLNYQTLIEIDTTPSSTPTWARVAAGISDFDPSNNEVLDQTGYLDGQGYNSTDVTGAQHVLTLNGHRVYGDEAQDYIDSLELEVGCARKTNFRTTDPVGVQKTGPGTIANVDFGGGDANSKSAISFELHFNGKPTRSAKAQAGALTSVVVGGTASGTTSFTATPDVPNTLAYKLGAVTFGTLYVNQYISGMTAYTSGEDIEAVAGQFLLQLELDENSRVIKYVELELQAGDITA